mmetsp:Transcript_21787/g.32575  ORF Transcript_21787/g.32575 Transcript_21787/m.32575 type:complete len:232 (+) Transcript_21787:179-874(+)
MSLLIFKTLVRTRSNKLLHKFGVFVKRFLNASSGGVIFIHFIARFFLVLQEQNITFPKSLHLILTIVGKHQCRMSIRVLLVELHSGNLQHGSNQVGVTASTGRHESISTILISSIDIGSLGHERLQHFDVTLGCGGDQRRYALVAGRGNCGSIQLWQHRIYNLGQTTVSSLQQKRYITTFHIYIIEAGALLNQKRGEFLILDDQRIHQQIVRPLRLIIRFVGDIGIGTVLQ